MQTAPQIQPGGNSPTVTSISPRKLSSSSGKIKLIAQVVAISSNLALLIGLIVVIAHLGKKKEDDVELTKGPRGRIGYVGKMGPKGDKGPDGDQGPRGPIGPSPVPVAIVRANLSEVFADFTSYSKLGSIYELLDMWGESLTDIPENHQLLANKIHLGDSTTEFANEMIHFQEKLIKVEHEKLNDSELAELIQQQISIDNQMIGNVDKLSPYFFQEEQSEALKILFSDFFLGRYFKNKKLLMEKIKKEYLLRIKEDNGILFKNYTDNYWRVIHIVKTIYHELFFSIKEKNTGKILIETLEKSQIKFVLKSITAFHLEALINYDYFCYYVFFIKLERKGEYSIVKVREKFKDIFKIVNIKRWEKNLASINYYAKKWRGIKLAWEDEENLEEKEWYEKEMISNQSLAFLSLIETRGIILKNEK